MECPFPIGTRVRTTNEHDERLTTRSKDKHLVVVGEKLGKDEKTPWLIRVIDYSDFRSEPYWVNAYWLERQTGSEATNILP